MVQADTGKGPLTHLWEDLGTASWQITREILIQGLACDWNMDDPELKALCLACFSGPLSTRDILESAFGWLRDSLRQAKNNILANWTQFLYLIACPYARSQGGMSQYLPLDTDFGTLLRSGFSDREILDLNVWAPAKTSMTDKLPDSPQAISKIRLAGFAANRVASAASAYAMKEVANDFRQCDAAWAGDDSQGFLLPGWM